MKPFTAPDTPVPAVRPMRIALATPGWPGSKAANGIVSAVSELEKGLTALGHDVTIISHWSDATTEDPRVIVLDEKPLPLWDRLMFRLFPDRVVRKAMISQLTEAAQLAIARRGIEVLLMEETLGWAGAVRQALPIPVIVTLHGPHWLHRAKPGRPRRGHNARRENWEAASLHKVDGLIAPSASVRDQTGVEWGLPNLPTAVIGNPVHFDLSEAPSARLTDPHILFVGRFDRIKGADVLIDAFGRIADRHPTCRLTFVGPDEGIAQPDGSRLHLADAIARLPATARDRITVLGRKSRDEVAALRRKHPITLITSRYETFGVALIEAMSAGSAVISSRVGGCAEVLEDGKTGLLVPMENPQALAEACLQLLADPALRLRLGTAAQADVAARFSSETIAREVVAFLAPLVGRT